MSGRVLTDEDVRRFEIDGYVLKPGFFDAEEVALLRRGVEADRSLKEHAFELEDGQGRRSELSLWNHPGDDVFGNVARSERIVDAMERLLGGEVYHYHTKLSMKRPGVGGSWNWHQDYGYWYKNGCLFPDMASVMVAIDPATRENGCLRVLKGSQRMGRIEHLMVGGQTGADMERVERAMERLETVECVMQPGDALFFHSNTLHASRPNDSDGTRDLLICCYNRASNDPYLDHHHPRYTPLEKLPDSAIVERGLGQLGANTSFMDPAQDRTIEVESEEG